MKSLMILIAALCATFAFVSPTHAQTAAKPLPALPTAQELPGELIFHGRYQHKSRGQDIAEPSELWVNRAPDGSIAAMAKFPAMQTVELVSGDQQHRPVSYRVRRSGRAPEYGMDLQFTSAQATFSRRGIRHDLDQVSLAVPADACFDPNSRPDSYIAANVLLRQFALQDIDENKEIRVFDWDNTGEKLADYTIRIEYKGNEQLQVPAGKFETRHLVLTQTSSADTWFKKRQGHTTDFWLLENGVIIRILRNREPYEMVLLDYDVPANLPGLRPADSDATARSANTPPPQASAQAHSIETMPPVVIKTTPASGQTDIQPGIAEVKVTFSKEMADNSWSWSTAWVNSAPEIIGKPQYDPEHRTCTVKVKLEPGKTYGWWLNSETFHGFQDKQGHPAVPYLLVFQTTKP